MYCWNCGKKLADDMIFCPYCGIAINSKPIPRPRQPRPQQPVGGDNSPAAQTTLSPAEPPQDDAEQAQYVIDEKNKNIFAKDGLALGIIGIVLALIAFFLKLAVNIVTKSDSFVGQTLIPLTYLSIAIIWIGFACILAGIALGVMGIVFSKKRGSLPMSIVATALSGVSLIPWMFFWIIL